MRTDEVLVAYAVLPPYFAVMEWDPLVRAVGEVVRLAVPDASPTFPIPTLPLKYVTVPEGTPPEEMTSAVKVTDWP